MGSQSFGAGAQRTGEKHGGKLGGWAARGALAYGTGGLSEKIKKSKGQAFGGVRPTAPKFRSLLDPSGERLQSAFQVGRFFKSPTEEQQSESERRLRASALAEDMSPQAQALLEQQQLGTARQLQAATRGAAGQLASQRAGLASRGGIGRGAAERLAGRSMEQVGAQQAGIRSGAEAGRLGIRAQDFSRQQQLQQQLANLSEQRRLQFAEGQARDVGGAVQDIRAKQLFDMARYQAEMQEFAAERAAAEQRNLAATSGGLLGGGGALGTGFKLGF